MNILVVSIHVIVCLVLIIVILLQAGRGQGLTGGSFGGGNVQSLFGTKASSFLTKATSVCAIVFLFTCIGLNILEVQKSRSLFKSPNAQASLDVEQIKKALAKIKQTDKTSAATATQTKTSFKTEVERPNATKLAESEKTASTSATTAEKTQP
ncbi:MAG: preprotein translocase subunit SecG [Candidatus Omnitrophota bacterium]